MKRPNASSRPFTTSSADHSGSIFSDLLDQTHPQQNNAGAAVDWNWAIAGGLLAGALAGGAARFGRLCTMSAIEDALIAQDRRAAKVWGLAIGSGIGFTQLFAALGWIDLSRTLYSTPQLHVLGALLGGTLFGLGMSLVGTCSFGLLIRAGGGDLRALISALVVGIFAFATTTGSLATFRGPLLTLGVADLSTVGTTIDFALAQLVNKTAATAFTAALVLTLVTVALVDSRLHRRPRMLASAIVLGLAIAVAWLMTSRAVWSLSLDRPESLTFVAPVGRALAQFMMQPFRNSGFGVAAVCGVIAASFFVATRRTEFRWEAFDDAHEMRRHLLGASLMGIGGVLAQGCTIGQGMSAASVMGFSAPLFLLGLMVGAKIGLKHLIEGSSMWRLGRAKG
jgi:uncharacterized protein